MQVDFVCPKCGASLRRQYIHDFEKQVIEIYSECTRCAYKSLAQYPKPAEVEAISQ